MLIDRAVAAYQDFLRIIAWTGNTALMVEHEFFGRDRPRAGFRDRHGEICGLTVEEYIVVREERLSGVFSLAGLAARRQGGPGSGRAKAARASAGGG